MVTEGVKICRPIEKKLEEIQEEDTLWLTAVSQGAWEASQVLSHFALAVEFCPHKALTETDIGEMT